jgi:hypothetical protein
VVRGAVLSALDVTGVEVLTYQSDALATLEQMSPLRFVVLLLRREFQRIRHAVPQKFGRAFEFCQRPSFSVLTEYDRQSLCIMDEMANWQ